MGGVKFGQIKLGFPSVSLYPNDGIHLENSGEIIFRGKANIGNHSFISVGRTGHLDLGDRFSATAGLKLTSYDRITFGDDVLVGWDNLFTDTDFHATKSESGKSVGHLPITIGAGTWYAMGSLTLKGTVITPKCVIGARSVLAKDYTGEGEEKLFISGNPAKVVRRGICRDPQDDRIEYVPVK